MLIETTIEVSTADGQKFEVSYCAVKDEDKVFNLIITNVFINRYELRMGTLLAHPVYSELKAAAINNAVNTPDV